MPDRPPVSDEELAAVTVGDLVAHNAPITLADYDQHWPELYAREEQRIRAILGPAVLEIHHAGSTSVPGLCAKPLIDMVLVVASSADEQRYVGPLERAGYLL